MIDSLKIILDFISGLSYRTREIAMVLTLIATFFILLKFGAGIS